MYAATITKSEHLTLSTPKGSDRLKIGYYPESNKFFLYVGFDNEQVANKSRDWLISRGHATAYSYKVDSGVNKGRKSQYSNQAWELKIHRPTTELVDLFIKAEIKRKQVKYAAGTPRDYGHGDRLTDYPERRSTCILPSNF